MTFDPISMPNRVLSKTNTTNNWLRLANIHTETGALVQVTYSQPECSSTNLPASPQNNTKLCYPVIGPDPLSTSGADTTEWWHKYVVKQVAEADVQLADAHQAPTKNTYYTYEGTPAWHYADDDGLSKAKYRTWNQFRGYKTVDIRAGDTDQTLTKTTYFRGMSGDKGGPAGGIVVDASLGTETVYDQDQFAGMIREQVVYNGTDDKPVSKTVSVPWLSAPTATRTIGDDTVTARFVNTGTSYAATALGVNGARGWRVTSTQTSYDSATGLPTKVQDNGDIAATGDEKCTTTVYNPNTSINLISLPKRVTTTTLPCSATPTSPDQFVDDALTFYDGATSADTVPTFGNLTRTDLMKNWTAAAGTTWLTSGKSTFDAFGRQLTEIDVRGNTTTYAYTPANKLVTQKTETNSLGWVTTTVLNPAWSVPTKVVEGPATKLTDISTRNTETTYDPLGRALQVWEPGWPRVNSTTPASHSFTYYFDANRKTYPHVKTASLNAGGGTNVSFQVYDGMLRPRQTQVEAVGGGRVVADTIYDQFGRVEATYAGHTEPGDVSGALWWEPEWSVPSQSVNVYDRAGRQTANIFRAGDGVINLVDKWRTSTTYEGDRTTVVPPQGGTPATTITDPLGRTTELREYTTAAGVSGAYTSIKYAYNDKNKMTSAADSAGDTWTYKYDILGRQTEAVDPDGGKSTSAYNDYGDLTSGTDARNQTLAYTYDSIGRKTGLYDGSVADANKRAEWIYDKLYSGAPAQGQLTQAIRYDIAADGTRQPYKWQARGFNLRNEISGEHWVIPAAETGLGGTYVYSHSYSPYTGDSTEVGYPAAGPLVAEGVSTVYDQTTGLPKFLNTAWSDVDTYVVGQQYTGYGEPTVTTLKIGGGVYAEQNVAYELDTRRVHQVQVKPETATGDIAVQSYQYDSAGNVLSVTDTPQVGQADKQCFAYDQMRRLVSAWTPATDASCGTTPTVDKLAGPAPYWLDWTIDNLGNRTKEVAHTSAGTTTREYQVPTPGTGVVRPHAVTGMTTTTPDGSSTTVGYGYDAAGNMTSRPGVAATQTLTYDPEGNPTKVVEGATTTTNLYDANGTRLIRRDASGATLFLPGQEIRRLGASTTANDATRYYSFAGRTIASRTPGIQTLTWLFGDNQGTATIAVNAYTQKVSIRRQTPYGTPRGVNPDWPNNKGFVGGDNDPTGLTRLGARDYDPALGRFISVDPVLDLADPQQINGYAYANNNPTTFNDPDGLRVEGSVPGCNPGNGGSCNGYVGPEVIPQSEKHHNPPAPAPTPTRGGNRDHDDSPSYYNASSSNSGGGGGHSGKNPPKKKPWWDRATDWVADNANTLAGAAAGIGTFVACEAVTAGAGTLGCMALSGAVGNLVTSGLNGDIHSATDFIDAAATGAIGGILAVPLAAADLATQAGAIGQDIKEGDTAGALGHGALAALDVAAVVGGVKGIKSKAKATESSAAAERSAASTKCSFAAATPVLLANGATKPIGEIEVGDKVVATDPMTGETANEPVEVLFDNVDYDLADLTLMLADGKTSVLKTTANHPFWDVSVGAWIDAGRLIPGHRLLSASRQEVIVKSARLYTGPEHRLNLTVADMHTYYVLAGGASVLVHNVGESCVVTQTLGPGPFAREGVGLVNGNINAPGVRQLINLAGDAHGCHTCGTRVPGTKYGSWIPDHQAPTKLVLPGLPQTAYPHCLPCARQQAGIVTQLKRGNYEFS
ncbi:polymorphic toxin-type HINT domain-containing protein [Actinoplanes sp. CA-054009]